MHGIELSASGSSRRDEIRAQLVGGMRARRRRSRALQAASLAAAIVLVLVSPGLHGAADEPARSTPATGSPAPAADLVHLVIDHGDADVVQRLRIDAAESRVRLLQDDDLVATLHDCGRAGGVMRVAGRLEVVGVVPDDWQ